jgi:hypothetical protein
MVPNSQSAPGGDRHGERAPEGDPYCACHQLCATRAYSPPSQECEKHQRGERHKKDQMRLGGDGRHHERHGCSNGEPAIRGPRSLNRARTKRLEEAEFISGMRSRRIEGH